MRFTYMHVHLRSHPMPLKRLPASVSGHTRADCWIRLNASKSESMPAKQLHSRQVTRAGMHFKHVHTGPINSSVFNSNVVAAARTVPKHVIKLWKMLIFYCYFYLYKCCFRERDSIITHFWFLIVCNVSHAHYRSSTHPNINID